MRVLILLSLFVLQTTRAFVVPTASFSSRLRLDATTLNDYDAPIAEAKQLLVRAAETKSEDSDLVVEALEGLEKLMRQKCKAEPDTAPKEVLKNLNGAWRLVFTTGTKKTQDNFKTRLNYFPLKAVQTFDTTQDPMKITNGIFVGDFPLIKFSGEFDFDLKKRKLEFDFDEVAPLGFGIKINQNQAAQIGASSGLGSESNVENAKRGRQAFFNWISADDKIATARGGGGGLALWKRIAEE